jgi:hypothetical protein
MLRLGTLGARTMQYIVLGVFQCVGSACCWYNVFRCCGCIDSGHVEIEKQRPVLVVPPQSPNPFLTGGSKGPYFESAYK